MQISVVIPAYNERVRLPPTLETLEAYLKAHYDSWEIIVADDGSTDGTVAELKPKFPRIRFSPAPYNEGKGAAVRRGMLLAEGDLALFTDADLSTPIEDLEEMERTLERGGYDVVIASRGLPDSVLEHRQPLWRELSGKIFNGIVRPLAGLPHKDTQCGFKLFKREAAQRIFSLTRCNGFAFDVEALMLAETLGLSVHEMAVRWSDSEGSKVSLAVDAPKMVFDILRFRWRFFTGQYQNAE